MRLRRFFLAAFSYLLWIGISGICQFAGMSRIETKTAAFIWILIVLNNLFFYFLLRSGLNKKIHDPSLTIPQMLAAIFWSGVVSYITLSPIRGSMLALFLVIFIFGVFKLSFKQFLWLVAAAVATYAAAMLLLLHNDPGTVDPVLEGIRTLLLLVTLMWFSLIGSYIQNLRKKVIKANSELQSAMETIEELVIHDELTGVHNRRQMFTVLNREKSLSDRTNMPFAVCLLDLDDFKKINDTKGHLTGDKVLRKFAQAIKNHIRQEDYIARYGGEEFLVIFTGRYCVENSSECALRLQALTERMKFPEIEDDLRLTTSIGVTVYQPQETIDSLLTRVDAAMYEAKNKGKNRIEQTPANPQPQK